MKLRNLADIFDRQDIVVKEFLKRDQTELRLTLEFKNKYKELVTNHGGEIYFEEFSAKLKTSTDKIIFIPNQWFYLAYLATPFYSEFTNYRTLILKNSDGIDLGKFCSDAKSGNVDEDLFQKLTLGIDEQDAALLKKFLSNYKWWHGGKTIDRGDSFVSPVLSLLYLVNVSAGYVADITQQLVDYSFELDNSSRYFVIPEISDSQEVDVFEPLPQYDITCNQRPYPLQQIHFGAPGTGKSYSLAQIIGESYEGYKDTDDNPFVFRTTVHNEYSYYDFVGNIMPKSEDGAIDYTFIPGIFTLALEKALTNPQNDIYLIIEEMSRGNIAAIFGDIFQLLDRDDEGVSEYRINNAMISDYINRTEIKDGEEEKVNNIATLDKIYLPRNLHILGTANTSDQNVNVIDTAFKRRFGFVYQSVKPADKDGQLLNAYTLELSNRSFEWNEFYQKLNLFIVNSEKGLGLTEDKQLGQFFVKFKQPTADSTDEERHQIVTANFDAIRNKVLNYLWEDVQSVAMTEQKIFNHDLTAFSSLYELFDDKKRPTIKEIFSEEFMTFYDHEELG